MTTPKKVTILTGFLGAGKTTFLNAILAQRKDIRYAIIENEFGEEGIDNELVINPNDDLIEMNNGCLCCTLNDNLYDILTALHERRDEFDELIIESTGIADPIGIAEPFLTHPALLRHFPLQRVICLVDASQIEHQLLETEEAIKQIAFSEVILLNKCDTVSSEYLAELKEKLQKITPFATIFEGNKDHYKVAEIFSVERNAVLEDTFSENEVALPQKKHTHHHHHKHGEITSLSFRFTEIFDIQKLRVRLYQFLFLQSQGLYRMKGVFFAENSPNKIIFQSVGSKLSVEEGREWREGEEKVSKIVFIGKNLGKDGYEKMLKQCLRN
jgi:G3E family GTPase